MITQQLDKLLAAQDGCRALALADIGAQTVYCVSARVQTPQERLDALCEAAGAVFTGGANPGGPAARSAVIFGPQEVLVLARGATQGSEALLAICDPAIDVEHFLRACYSSLEDIAEAQQ